MAQVVTFERYVPIPRYDSLPWTQVRIEESATETGTYATVETIALSPVDTDPSDPQARSFTTELAGDGELWYRIVFVDANADESAPTDPVQNTDVIDAYASVNELARVLKIRTPTEDQTYALGRVLLAAAGEINSEIDLPATSDLAGWQLELCAQVNLERAAELWKFQEVQFGIVGLGSEFGATHIARDTWKKHSIMLGPLKQQWGFAQVPAAENSELLDAMADQIRDALDDVTDVAVQVEPRMVAAPSPPTIDMYPGDLSRGTEAAAFGVEGEFLFTVRARVDTNDADANQDLLLAFMDDINPLSVPMALMDDPTLGGLATAVDCVDPTGYVMYPYGAGETLLGFQFTAKVIRAES